VLARVGRTPPKQFSARRFGNIDALQSQGAQRSGSFYRLRDSSDPRQSGSIPSTRPGRPILLTRTTQQGHPPTQAGIDGTQRRARLRGF
jgi:hypothetical protein